ncbi:MAG: ferrous iron transport protein B [Candidatus Hermodarchaeota archaeon]
MHCHDVNSTHRGLSTNKIVLVGNPNVGKSVIFGSLTGKYATVSNYPGTTVEITTGEMLIDEIAGKCLVIDTPGTNSLQPSSEDERVTRNVLLREDKPEAIVLVGDMKNLRRSLHLIYELRALVGKIPILLVLNMQDEAQKRGIFVDTKKLRSLVGVPVIPATAIKKIGIDQIYNELRTIIRGQREQSPFVLRFNAEIEYAISSIQSLLEDCFPDNGRGLSEMLLRGDEELLEWIKLSISDEQAKEIEQIISTTQTQFPEHLSLIMKRELDAEIQLIVDTCSKKEEPQRRKDISNLLDRACLNPVTGIPIFIGVVSLIFLFVGVIGAGEAVDFLESIVFGEYINPMFTQIIDFFLPIPIIHELLVGEYGVVTFGLTYALAIVFPVVTCFFIAFSILEDSGYLPRLAFLGDKLFQYVGLNGKAVLPIVLGTGCGTMATMTARILETRKERLIATMMLALGVPCSAQLAVIFGVLTFVSPVGVVVVFGVVFLQLLLVAYMMKLLVPGEKSDFIMELPPLRVPALRNIIVKTWARVEWFLKEAIPLFVLGTLIISLLNLFPLLEIMQYILVLAMFFLFWKLILVKKSKIPQFAKNNANLIVLGGILPIAFFVLYFTQIPYLISSSLISSLSLTGLLFETSLLNVIIEFFKPLMIAVLGLPPEASIMYILGFLRRDYGAAGFFDMATQGIINANQIVVGTIVLTLFVPCVAQFLVMAKERGSKTAIIMILFIIPFAVLIGAIVNFLLNFGGIQL